MNSRTIIFSTLTLLLVMTSLVYFFLNNTESKMDAPVVVHTPPLAAEVEVEPVNEAEKYFKLDDLVSGSEISSPLQLSGEARGKWFFEASFPIELRDESGVLLAQAIATADGEWMTDDFVAWNSQIKWATTSAEKGVLKFIRDNPSGLPEHDLSSEIEVYLK